MRALNIRSLAELKLEAERYPSTDDSEYKGVASELLLDAVCGVTLGYRTRRL